MKKTLFLIVLILFVSCTENPEDKLLSFNGYTMGTTYSIKIVKEKGEESIYENLQSRIDEVLKNVNLSMSTYIDSSEISRFNNSKAGEWFSVSEDLKLVLTTAKKVNEESGGAFDITVGPLVNLWGFGPEKDEEKIPSDSAIEARKEWVGSNKIQIDSLENKIQKDIDKLYCDLSAIAKGFGVDKVAGFLYSLGIENYMVEIGGEVSTHGMNHKNEPWQIGIAVPDSYSGIQNVVPLSNLAMATSGDYRNYFEENGVRYSHTIDTRTGKPITHNLASVTVVYENCMTADAVATAIDVLGPDEGMKLAKKLNVAVYMIIRGKDGFIQRMNSRFEKLLSTKK